MNTLWYTYKKTIQALPSITNKSIDSVGNAVTSDPLQREILNQFAHYSPQKRLIVSARMWRSCMKSQVKAEVFIKILTQVINRELPDLPWFMEYRDRHWLDIAAQREADHLQTVDLREGEIPVIEVLLNIFIDLWPYPLKEIGVHPFSIRKKYHHPSLRFGDGFIYNEGEMILYDNIADGVCIYLAYYIYHQLPPRDTYEFR